MSAVDEQVHRTNAVSLNDEEAVKKVLVDSVLGRWDVVNNPTQTGISTSSGLISGVSNESIASRTHSTRPGHIFPTRINGVFSRWFTCSNCQIIIVSSTVPMPPGATMKASDASTK